MRYLSGAEAFGACHGPHAVRSETAGGSRFRPSTQVPTVARPNVAERGGSVERATSPAEPSLRGSRRSRRIVIVLLAVVLVAGSAVGVYLYERPGPATVQESGGSIDRIQHIFIVVQESRSFDSYFGTYCNATSDVCSSTSNGLPGGVCLPYNLSNPSSGCVAPYALPPGLTSTDPVTHTASASNTSYDGGRMDGFVVAAQGNPTSMGYYSGRTVGGYWDLAEEYALGDDFFSGALSYSLPNHWLLVAGSLPNASFGGSNFTSANGTITSKGTAYLNEANATLTLPAELSAKSIGWTYYDFAIPANSYSRAVSNGTVWRLWNPLAAQAESYAAENASHFAPSSRIFSDLASGNVTSVSWVIPNETDSEDPPYRRGNGGELDTIGRKRDRIELGLGLERDLPLLVRLWGLLRFRRPARRRFVRARVPGSAHSGGPVRSGKPHRPNPVVLWIDPSVRRGQVRIGAHGNSGRRRREPPLVLRPQPEPASTSPGIDVRWRLSGHPTGPRPLDRTRRSGPD